MKYERPSAGGVWDHHGQDCPEHGDNVAHARPHKSSVAWQCVACMLECEQLLATKERK